MFSKILIILVYCLSLSLITSCSEDGVTFEPTRETTQSPLEELRDEEDVEEAAEEGAEEVAETVEDGEETVEKVENEVVEAVDGVKEELGENGEGIAAAVDDVKSDAEAQVAELSQNAEGSTSQILNQLEQKSSEVTDEVKQGATQVEGEVEPVVEDSKEAIRASKESTEDNLKDLTSDADKRVAEVNEEIDEQASKLSENAEDISSEARDEVNEVIEEGEEKLTELATESKEVDSKVEDELEEGIEPSEENANSISSGAKTSVLSLAGYIEEVLSQPDSVSAIEGGELVEDEELVAAFLDYVGAGFEGLDPSVNFSKEFKEYKALLVHSNEEENVQTYVLVPGCLRKPGNGELDDLRTDTFNPFDRITFAAIEKQFPVLYQVVREGKSGPYGVMGLSDVVEVEISDFSMNKRFRIKKKPMIQSTIVSGKEPKEFQNTVNEKVMKQIASLSFCK